MSELSQSVQLFHERDALLAQFVQEQDALFSLRARCIDLFSSHFIQE